MDPQSPLIYYIIGPQTVYDTESHKESKRPQWHNPQRLTVKLIGSPSRSAAYQNE